MKIDLRSWIFIQFTYYLSGPAYNKLGYGKYSMMRKANRFLRSKYNA